MTLLIVALATGASVQLSVPEHAAAGHQRNCGVVSKGSSDWRVRATNMGCRKAKKGARRYLRAGDALPGFVCSRDGGFFFCGKGEKAYTGQRL